MKTSSKYSPKIRQALFETLEDRRLFAADLTGAFAGVVPTALKLTGTNSVTVKLDNVGTTLDSGSATVALYLSSSPSLESGDTALPPVVSKGLHLKAGGVQNVTLKFASPTGVANGNYYLVAQLTPSAKTGDIDTADKVFATPGTVSVQKAFVDLTDAVTKSISAPISVVAKHQKTATATVTVTNAGNITAKGKLTVSLYAATHTTLNSSDTLLLTKSLGEVSLAAGKSKAFAIKLTPGATDPSGSFYLLAGVNPTALISETNSANNIASSAAQFTVVNPAIAAGPYLAGALSSSVTSVYTNEAQQSTFDIFIGRANASTAVEVDEFDSSGNDLGEITSLVDDGDTTQGDAVAGDGIYTGIASIDSTSVGTRYFAAVVTDPLLSASKTSPTVSIAATAPPTPTITSSLSANISKVAVGTSEVTTFTVSVTNASSATTVDVDEFDSSGNNLGELTQLYDDGSAANGDLKAGDGIFSGINTVGFTAPGTRYFAPVVTDATLASPLQGNTLSILGATAPTPAQLQADTSDASSLEATPNSIITGGGTASSALSALQTALASDTNVDQTTILATANNVAWSTTDGIPFIYDTTDTTANVKGAAGAVPSASTAASPAAAASSASNPSATPQDTSNTDDSNKTAIVLDPFEWDFASADEAGPIASSLSAAGYAVTEAQNTTSTATNVSLTDFADLGQYDAVVISTHGGLLSGGGEFLVSGVPVDNTNTNEVNDFWNHELVNATIADSPGVTYYGITPSFINDNTGTMDGTIVYVSACYSAADSQMASAFVNNGAGAYIGYTDEVGSGFAYSHGIAAFNTLLQTTDNTVGDIPGINTDVDTSTPGHAAKFVAYFGQTALDATLPTGLLLSNYELYVQYNWPQNVSDLDTRTTFLGTSVGWSLDSSSSYITWSGDNTSAGGNEYDDVNLNQAFLDGQFAGSTTVGVGADWYTPADGSGPAYITIGLKNLTTGVLKQVYQEDVNPGQEDSGTQDTQFIVTANLGGSSTNPTVKISVAPASN